MNVAERSGLRTLCSDSEPSASGAGGLGPGDDEGGKGTSPVYSKGLAGFLPFVFPAKSMTAPQPPVTRRRA
jgi:hypothetical protein